GLAHRGSPCSARDLHEIQRVGALEEGARSLLAWALAEDWQMRTVFVGTNAFIGRVDGLSRCAFWADEPVGHGFDRRRLIEVDLANTPQAAAARKISWEAVEVDDCIVGAGGKVSGTTIGPRWPEMQLSGVVYMEIGHWERLPAKLRFPRPPRDVRARDYEHTR